MAERTKMDEDEATEHRRRDDARNLHCTYHSTWLKEITKPLDERRGREEPEKTKVGAVAAEEEKEEGGGTGGRETREGRKRNKKKKRRNMRFGEKIWGMTS